jgi:hypothetical protein
VSRRAFAALGLVAAALVSVIALELEPTNEDPALPVIIRRAPLVQTAHAHTPAAPSDHTDEWVTTTLARPLFSRDRRPAPASSSPAAAAAEIDGLPRLTSVLVGPFGRIAIFAAAEGSKPLVLNEGGSLGAYSVNAIVPGQVTVKGPEGVRVLRPAFDPNAPLRPPEPALLPRRANEVAPRLPPNLQQRLGVDVNAQQQLQQQQFQQQQLQQQQLNPQAPAP